MGEMGPFKKVRVEEQMRTVTSVSGQCARLETLRE